jgi:hypothetical protein
VGSVERVEIAPADARNGMFFLGLSRIVSLLLLLSGYASQSARAEAPMPVEVTGVRSPNLTLFIVTNLATGQEKDRQALAPALTGMQRDVRLDPSGAAHSQSPDDLNRGAPSGHCRKICEELSISAIVDSGLLRQARPAEIETLNATQSNPGGAKPRAPDAKPSAEGMRPRAWSMGLFGSDVLRNYDHAMVSAYLPMRGAVAVQRISNRLFQSEEPGALISGIRALTLVARGRINAELVYSAQISRFSNLDATARYRLNAAPNTGKSDLVMGLYYKATF